MPVLGRDDLEVGERPLPPAQERVALPVALELELGVARDREPRRVLVDLDRVVDHELGRAQRVDPLWIASEIAHCVPHGREVDHRGHAREVLQEHATGREGDLLRGLGRRVPRRDGLDVVRGHVRAVLVPEHVLEQDAQRVRQAVHVEALLERSDAEDLELATADRELAARSEAVGMAITLDSITLGPVQPVEPPLGERRPARIEVAGDRLRVRAADAERVRGEALVAHRLQILLVRVEQVLPPDRPSGVEERETDADRDLEQARPSRVGLVDERGVHAGKLPRAWQALRVLPQIRERALESFHLERWDVDEARGRSACSLECGEQLVDGRELGVAGDDAGGFQLADQCVQVDARSVCHVGRSREQPERREAEGEDRPELDDVARALADCEPSRRLLELARDRLRGRSTPPTSSTVMRSRFFAVAS